MDPVGFRTVFIYALRRQLLDRKWIMVLLLALLVAAIMGYAAIEFEEVMDGAVDLTDLLILGFLLPLVTMIYGTSLMRNEVDDRSIVLLVTSPVDRRVVYLAFYTALVVATCLMTATMTISGWIAYLYQTGPVDGWFGLMAGMIGIIWVGCAVYGALFLLIGVSLERPIYLGLLYAFIWEGFVGALPGGIGEMTIRHQLLIMASAWIDIGTPSGLEGSAEASMALSTLLVILLALGAMVFRSHEYP